MKPPPRGRAARPRRSLVGGKPLRERAALRLKGNERGEAFRRPLFAAASRACSRCEREVGMAIPARIPMTMTTTRASTSVKPHSSESVSCGKRRFSILDLPRKSAPAKEGARYSIWSWLVYCSSTMPVSLSISNTVVVSDVIVATYDSSLVATVTVGALVEALWFQS